ncbi:MAG: hypothetical protein KatS3mg090_0492 [Patescibacteria group bacterium]|nr:MAG: hypothetical protein KatS3mg090_0492 [Patescibacteria group bacterium]
MSSSDSSSIKLSVYTKALVELLRSIKPKPKADELSKVEVSSTASFFGLFYEKLRNSIEYKEQNLIRRSAIERILKRRLALNPTGKDEAENLIRELLWARYFTPGSLTYSDIVNVQALLDKYLNFYRKTARGKSRQDKILLSDFIMSLLSCEIEENLAPEESLKQEYFNYFVFQVLKGRIKFQDLQDESLQEIYIFAAVDKTYSKSDKHYMRYHIFKLLHNKFGDLQESELNSLSFKFLKEIKLIDSAVVNPYLDQLSKFVKLDRPAFYILQDIINNNLKKIEDILSNESLLKEKVVETCNLRYEQSQKRLSSAAFKSLIYVFVTKMLFALILEFPLSAFIYGQVEYFSIIINSLFPPTLLYIIVSLTSVPGDDNTEKIYERIVEIINEDESYEKAKVFVTKRPKEKRPILKIGFSIFYSLTFLIVLLLISDLLDFFNFNLISKSLFVFFVSVVSFFAYRVRGIANEYRIIYKRPILQPIIDFFSMPILSLGKFFSQEIGRLNVFIIIFDFLIEAPFKLLVEIIEEWVRFVRSKKEEIVS